MHASLPPLFRYPTCVGDHSSVKHIKATHTIKQKLEHKPYSRDTFSQVTGGVSHFDIQVKHQTRVTLIRGSHTHTLSPAVIFWGQSWSSCFRGSHLIFVYLCTPLGNARSHCSGAVEWSQWFYHDVLLCFFLFLLSKIIALFDCNLCSFLVAHAVWKAIQLHEVFVVVFCCFFLGGHKAV